MKTFMLILWVNMHPIQMIPSLNETYCNELGRTFVEGTKNLKFVLDIHSYQCVPQQ